MPANREHRGAVVLQSSMRSAAPLNPPAQTNSKTTRDVMGAFVKASLEGINQKAWKTHDKVIKH